MQTKNGTLTVDLSSARNPDVGGGYWTPGRRPRASRAAVASIKDAVRVVGEYIEKHGLGNGNWTGGTVRRDGTPIAHVSYNGRVWEITPEAASAGRTGPGALWDDDAREIDPETGERMVFGPCAKCGEPGFGSDVTAKGTIDLCLPHLRPWHYAAKLAVSRSEAR